MTSSSARYGVFLLLLFFLTACQPKVYLMPAPIGIGNDTQFFSLSEDSRDENLLYTLYATNRIPFDKLNNSTGYTIFPSNILELGYLVHSVGYDGMLWDDLQSESLKPDRDASLLLTQEYVMPMVDYHKDDDLTRRSSRDEQFFQLVNETLVKSFDKDITVYVHGANSSFYRATAMGASFFHFTGHNSIILTFSWPSAESLFRYKIDVMHARKTIPAFASLLEILATHTKARNINIIAYSAGAQVVAPGLAYLHDLYPALSSKELKEKFRIGEIYFAAPDTAFLPFVERYLKFRDIVVRTTISLNQNDRILLLAAMHNGVSSLGRPDISELSDDEKAILLDAVSAPDLDVIDVGASKALNIGKGHDYWYNNTWVSTDLLLLLFFNASPEERGLVESSEQSDEVLYYFPDNYAEIISSLIQDMKDKMEMKILHDRKEQI